MTSLAVYMRKLKPDHKYRLFIAGLNMELLNMAYS